MIDLPHIRSALPRPGIVLGLAGLATLLLVVPSRSAHSQSPAEFARLANEVSSLRAESSSQKQQIVQLQAQVAGLDWRTAASAREFAIGRSTNRRIELRAQNNVIVMDDKGILIDGRDVTIKGRNINLDGDNIAIKGSPNTLIKGGKISDN